MTVENKHPEFGAYRHLQPEIVRTMRCRLVRAATRLGGHMKISLLNPHVSEVHRMPTQHQAH